MTDPISAERPRQWRSLTGAVLLVLAFLSPLGTGTLARAETAEGSSAAVSDDQRRITAGGLHTCAVLDSGEVQCWGANANGQLGNETTASSVLLRTAKDIKTALAVSAGNSHTCALIHDGTVSCWGHNGSGQIGNDTTSPPAPQVSAPMSVTGIDDALSIAAGGFHNCAVRANGAGDADNTVSCWGHDGSGQLGDGGPTTWSLTPVTVQHDHDNDGSTALADLTGVTAVTAGEFHSCALIGASGAVKCWGHNGFGQLGNGTTLPNGIDSSIAVAVNGLPVDDGHNPPGDDHGPHKVLAIAAGQAHTCAIVEGTPGNGGNTARCWGHNFYGQLGNNTTYTLPNEQGGTDSSTPVDVRFDANTDPLEPADIQKLGGVVSITAGQFHSCAGLVDGSARCWGNNGRGQLGDNNALEDPPKNKKVATHVDLGGVRAITAGAFHTCALVTGNALRCWGYNFHGQLGSYRASSHVPVTVTALSGARFATTGDDHACALVETAAPPADRADCWGNNANGELGANLTPSPANSMIPVIVDGIADVGAPDLDPPATLPQLISAGNDHACALPTPIGTPECWGRNTDGQLGNGGFAASDEPVAVSGITTATQVSAGGHLDGTEVAHTCARLADATARCWGENAHGQLGNDSTTQSPTAAQVVSDHDDDHLTTNSDPEPLGSVVEVAAGGSHACARLTNGRVRCWGANGSGQLGDGTKTDRHEAVTVDKDDLEPDEHDPDDHDPSHFDPLTGVIGITAGGRHSCAVVDGTDDFDEVWCWGANESGQLGNGTFTQSDKPVKTDDFTGAPFKALSVSAGDSHTCARMLNTLTGNTFALCWGDDTLGQLGDEPAGNWPSPTPPEDLEDPGSPVSNVDLVKAVTAGRRNSCATLIDTTVSCWGDNSEGQLGDGVGQQSEAPIAVLNLASPVGGNSIPAPQDDAATIVIPPPPGLPLAINVLANDSDADGDALTVSQVEDPARGAATTDGTTVTYTPDGNFCSADPTTNVETFRYWVDDGPTADPGPWAFISVTVNCANTAPAADDDTATTNEDSVVVIDVTDGDTDINGDDVTVGSVGQPPNGTVTINGPENKTVTYTPDLNFFGADTFTYRATDGTAQSAEATVTVTVEPVNDPPVATDDNGATDEDTALTINLVANDTDVDDAALGVKSVADAPHGTTSVASTTGVTYSPDANFCGIDTFAYEVTDGDLSDSGSVTVSVACTNDGPNAVNDSATTSEDSPVVIQVLANDTDPEGESLTVTQVTDPSHGTATINGGLSVTYTPDPDFCGPDGFAYWISDPSNETDWAEVVPVVVVCHNDPPVAADDAATTNEDTAKAIDVLANDTDVDGDDLLIVSVADPAHGTATVTSSDLVNYVPGPNYCGADTFDYTLADPDGVTATASVSVSVTCVNDAPVAADVANATTPWGEPIEIPLTASDVDAGDTATFSLVSGPPASAVVGSAFVWTPGKTQVGTHTITVRATDTGGGFDNETFSITVTKRATALSYTGAVDGQYSDPAAVSATLVDFEGAGVSGATVTFSIGSRTTSGPTDGGGVASGQIVLGTPVGPTSVVASFGGDPFHDPSSTSSAFTVEKEAISTSFSGPHLTTTEASSASVQLGAIVAEENDGHTGSSISSVQVAFREVGGSVLCTAPVSMTMLGAGAAFCTTPALALGSRAIVVEASSVAYDGPVDVATFAVAQLPSGSAVGAGRVLDGADVDDFAFTARPVRKSPPAGDAVHVYRSGSVARVVATDSLTSLSKSCSGGKAKVCTASIAGGAAQRWSVDLATGIVSSLSGTSSISLSASDAAGPNGAGADTYGATITGTDARTLTASPLSAGNIRIA